MNFATRAAFIVLAYVATIYWRKDADLVGILILLGSVAFLLGPYATDATGSRGLFHRISAPSPTVVWYIFGIVCFIAAAWAGR